jgi:hypothetical protein
VDRGFTRRRGWVEKNVCAPMVVPPGGSALANVANHSLRATYPVDDRGGVGDGVAVPGNVLVGTDQG